MSLYWTLLHYILLWTWLTPLYSDTPLHEARLSLLHYRIGYLLYPDMPPSSDMGVLTFDTRGLIIQKLIKIHLHSITNCTGTLTTLDLYGQLAPLLLFECQQECDSLIDIYFVKGRTQGFLGTHDFHGSKGTVKVTCMVQHQPHQPYQEMQFQRAFQLILSGYQVNAIPQKVGFELKNDAWETLSQSLYLPLNVIAEINEDVHFDVSINHQVFSLKSTNCNLPQPLFLDGEPKLNLQLIKNYHVERLENCTAMLKLHKITDVHYEVLNCSTSLLCQRPYSAYFVDLNNQGKKLKLMNHLHNQSGWLEFRCFYRRHWRLIERVVLASEILIKIKHKFLGSDILFLRKSTFENIVEFNPGTRPIKFQILETASRTSTISNTPPKK